MEMAQRLQEVVICMDFGTVTVWTVIKRFLFGWIAAGGLLVIVSCVKYREFIISIVVLGTPKEWNVSRRNFTPTSFFSFLWAAAALW